MTATPYILSLQDIVDEPVGGKAEGLARLLHMHLDVPPGFVILHAQIDQLPHDLATRYMAIGGGKVAVRSSAIGEDAGDASFAGQYETILNVDGIDALRDAIHQCLASLVSVRAQAYKDKGALPETEMAVVVQQMVDARCAGVLFTVDPVTSQRDHIVIDVAAGLGDRLVSGEVTPDHFVVSRATRTIITRELTSTAPLLTDEELHEIVIQALRAESMMGLPIDMEWAIDQQGVLRWLQARPITTLAADPNELDTPLLDASHVYTLCNVSEALPGAMCPLTLSVTNRGLEIGMQRLFIDTGMLEREDEKWYVMASFYNHLFMNMSTLARTPRELFGGSADDVALAVCGRLLPELKSDDPPTPLLQRLRKLPGYFLTILSGNKNRDRMRKIVVHLQLARQATALAQWHMIDAAMGEMHKAHHSHLVSSMASGMLSPTLLRILAGKSEPSEEHHALAAALLAGAENVESANIAQGASRIQELLLAMPEAAQQFANATPEDALAFLRSPASGEAGCQFIAYLQRHGHRSISEMDVRSREWACDPLPLVKSLQIPLKGFLTQQQAGQKVLFQRESVVAHELLAQQPAPVRQVVKMCHKAIRGREESKSLLLAIKQKFKQAYRDLAELLVADGLLPDNDAIYFLTHNELGRLVRTRSSALGVLAEQRRAIFPYQQSLRFQDVFVGKPVPLTPDLTQYSGTKMVRGKPVSRGIVRGRVKVALTIHDAEKLQPGDILVAPITDVAWTPYFSLIAGLVTDIGSSVSHGAVVAREFGLPAIVKTDIATQVFVDGDEVILDANNGIVRLVDAGE